jgi:hypothetical protein
LKEIVRRLILELKTREEDRRLKAINEKDRRKSIDLLNVFRTRKTRTFKDLTRFSSIKFTTIDSKQNTTTDSNQNIFILKQNLNAVRTSRDKTSSYANFEFYRSTKFKSSSFTFVNSAIREEIEAEFTITSRVVLIEETNSTAKLIIISEVVSIVEMSSTTNDVLFENTSNMLLSDYDLVYIDNAVKDFAQ